MTLYSQFSLNQTCIELAQKTDLESARILFYKIAFIPTLVIFAPLVLTLIITGVAGGFKKKKWLIMVIGLLLSLLLYILTVTGVIPFYYSFNPSIN